MNPISRRRHCLGVTLMEALVFAALWTLLAVCTMRVVGDARVLRSNARDRSEMTLIAQSELERVRQIPPVELAEKTTTRTDDQWRAGVHVTTTLKRREDGNWLVTVEVTRESVEGKIPVQLATIIRGSGS